MRRFLLLASLLFPALLIPERAEAKNVYDANHWPDLSHSEQSKADALPYAPFSLDAFA